MPNVNRIERALTATDFALREIRRTDSPGTLSGELATIWRARLGPVERAFLQATAVQAADAEDREELGFILGGPPPLGAS